MTSGNADDFGLTFQDRPIRIVTDFNLAEEAIHSLGLLLPSAIETIANLIPDCAVHGPKKLGLGYRKSGEQLDDAEKRDLGLRTNAMMSRKALDDLSELGKTRALDAHTVTLRRAWFHRTKIDTVLSMHGDTRWKIRFSPSHPKECAKCRLLDERVLEVEELKSIPIEGCERETCSAYLAPYRDWISEAI